MCPDRSSNDKSPEHLLTPRIVSDIDRLPRNARTLVRITCGAGVLAILASLPMECGYNTWKHEPYTTWRMLLFLFDEAQFFFPIVPFVLPFLLWYVGGVFPCIVNAFRPKGPKPSLLFPILSGLAPILLVVSFLFQQPSQESTSSAIGGVIDRGSGGTVNLIGTIIIFISTLPGLYYWIRRRVKKVMDRRLHHHWG